MDNNLNNMGMLKQIQLAQSLHRAKYVRCVLFYRRMYMYTCSMYIPNAKQLTNIIYHNQTSRKAAQTPPRYLYMVTPPRYLYMVTPPRYLYMITPPRYLYMVTPPWLSNVVLLKDATEFTTIKYRL